MADLDGLLARTSRTFALSIPRLPPPTNHAVTLAYLLFRIADTFEDAASWSRLQRTEALDVFLGWLRSEAMAKGDTPTGIGTMAKDWVAAKPTEHEGYLDLLAATEDVIRETAALPSAHRTAVLFHAARTAEGMKGFVNASTEDGRLQLASIEDLRGYCYVVAGIVGELLTDLFLLDAPKLVSTELRLRGNARSFGEGLQLVNILKDASDDARDGRTYLPRDVPRAEVLKLARRDLDAATEYVLALQKHDAPRGFVEFTALPVALARANLDRLEAEGAGAKVPREEVMKIATELDERLNKGEPALG